MSHPTQRRRALALVGAGALLATGLFSGIPANADDPAVAAGNIDTTQARTLTIHKHVENNSAAATPDGNGTVTGDPIEGVVFTLYPITKYQVAGGTATALNLATDTASWTALSNALGSNNNTNKVPGTACADAANGSFAVGTTTFTVGDGTPLTATSATGTSSTNPALGAYLVCETSAPATVIAPAVPFVVTVPYVYNNNWLYDVHVYPKNDIGTATKTVDPQDDLGLGSTVSFTVTSDIPTLPAGYTELKHYVVSDTFDARLTPTSAATTVSIGATTFVADTDYTIVTVGQEVRVVFTDAGLTKLLGHQGGQLTVVFQATVTSVGDGSIENTAEFSTSPTADYDPNKPGNETPEVVTNWGDVRISKIDGSNDKALAGAEFQVFEAKTPYPGAGVACSTETADGAAPISVNGNTTFTSDADGVVTIAGLFVSSTDEGANATTRCYVLKETKAPVGYVASGDVALTVTAGQTATTTYDATVENNKQLVPGLPLTGGEGTAIMTGGSLLLALIAAGAVVSARRRVKA